MVLMLVGIRVKNEAGGVTNMVLHPVSRERTFAGVEAFQPRVFCGTAVSTVVYPSTTRSATTASTGFFEGTALRAPHRRRNARRGNESCRRGWRGGCDGDHACKCR